MSQTARYGLCTACAEARKVSNLAEAVSCRSCKGTGIKRTRESWVCNGCGGGLCVHDDDVPYGLVDAAVSGAYSSTHLSDLTNYKFSLCEGCLRKLFDGFAKKPHISEYAIGVIGGGDMETGETYEEEAAARKKSDEENAASKAEFFKLYDEKRCADHDRDPASPNGNSLKEYCAREGFGQSIYEDSSWPYAKRWLCERHLRNAYARTDSTIYVTGQEPLTGPARCRIGLDLLTEFRAGKATLNTGTTIGGSWTRKGLFPAAKLFTVGNLILGLFYYTAGNPTFNGLSVLPTYFVCELQKSPSYNPAVADLRYMATVGPRIANAARSSSFATTGARRPRTTW